MDVESLSVQCKKNYCNAVRYSMGKTNIQTSLLLEKILSVSPVFIKDMDLCEEDAHNGRLLP